MALNEKHDRTGGKCPVLLHVHDHLHQMAVDHIQLHSGHWLGCSQMLNLNASDSLALPNYLVCLFVC